MFCMCVCVYVCISLPQERTSLHNIIHRIAPFCTCKCGLCAAKIASVRVKGVHTRCFADVKSVSLCIVGGASACL